MSRCTGRYCVPSSTFKHPEDPTGPVRYRGEQCSKVCEADSDLCKMCMKYKAAYDQGKKDKWHGYIHGEIPAESHIEGSEWNLKLRAKYAEKMASATMGEAVAAPKAKKAAKKALEAVAEAKEARIEAVAALKHAEAATNAVVAEVLRKSSSSSRKSAKKSPARVMLGMASMRFGSSSSPKKTARKAKTPKPKTARKPRTSRKTAKKSSNSAIYRPASASGSPMGGKNYAGYATPYSGSSSPSAAAALHHHINTDNRHVAASHHTSSTSGSGSGSGSNSGSSYNSANLFLQ